jgi:hypothetical protein
MFIYILSGISATYESVQMLLHRQPGRDPLNQNITFSVLKLFVDLVDPLLLLSGVPARR